MRKYASIALVISILLISTNAGGQENNYPNQTFSKCVQWSLANGGFKEEVKQDQKQQEYIREFEGEITAYYNSPSETGKSPKDPDFGITASGAKARVHHTVAASRNLKMGTRLKIEGLPYTFVVEDRGGAINTSSKLDMFVSGDKEAREWGRQHRKVYIISTPDGGNK